MNQRTLARKFTMNGIGLHCGKNVCLTFSPRPTGHGITMQRTDNSMSCILAARFENISSTHLSTCLGEGSSSISTVEHLMAALWFLGIDNLHVDVNGPEIPILDGSSWNFIDAFRQCGLVDQGIKRHYWVVKKRFEYTAGDQTIVIEPSSSIFFKCTIDFSSSVIGKQSATFSLSNHSIEAISKARTFCHLSDVSEMRKRGLALGGNLENAIVISDEGIINIEGLRSKNEFAQHKLLDLIGDFYLLGFPLLGRITASKPGHTLHARAMRELMLRKSTLLSVSTADHIDRVDVNLVQEGLCAYG